MRSTKDIPGYEPDVPFYTAYDGRPVTYGMCYTDGECPDNIYHRVEPRGYHCWHVGVDTRGPAFCCHCGGERPLLPDEPPH